MEDRLLIRWLLQVDLDGGAYLCETHTAGVSISIVESMYSSLGVESLIISCRWYEGEKEKEKEKKQRCQAGASTLLIKMVAGQWRSIDFR